MQEIGKLFLKVIKLKSKESRRKHKTTRNRKCVPFLTSGVGYKTRLKPSGEKRYSDKADPVLPPAGTVERKASQLTANHLSASKS